MREIFTAYTDGGSRGNPGKAAIGGVIFDSSGLEIFRYKKFLGINTNNFAEYSSLIFALEKSLDMGIKDLLCISDSELLVKQINGEYKVKSENLKMLFEKVLALIKKFRSFEIRHQKRENDGIKTADLLVNEALDENHV